MNDKLCGKKLKNKPEVIFCKNCGYALHRRGQWYCVNPRNTINSFEDKKVEPDHYCGYAVAFDRTMKRSIFIYIKVPRYQYKGYYSDFLYKDMDEGMYIGRILVRNDTLIFHCFDRNEYENEFKRSVDNYLSFCRSIGKEPDVPIEPKE